MNRRAREILRILADPIWAETETDPPDIVREGKACWFGGEKIRSSTIDQLLRCVAIKLDSEQSDAFERYSINDTGRAISRRPALETEILVCLATNRPFTITKTDRLEPLGPPNAPRAAPVGP